MVASLALFMPLNGEISDSIPGPGPAVRGPAGYGFRSQASIQRARRLREPPHRRHTVNKPLRLDLIRLSHQARWVRGMGAGSLEKRGSALMKPLGGTLGLAEEEPVVPGRGEPGVTPGQRLADRYPRHDAKPAHGGGVVKGPNTVRDPGSSPAWTTRRIPRVRADDGERPGQFGRYQPLPWARSRGCAGGRAARAPADRNRRGAPATGPRRRRRGLG